MNKQLLHDHIMQQFKRLVRNCVTEMNSALKESASAQSPKWIEYNKENVAKYKTDDNMLSHARANKNAFGWIVVRGNELIGYCCCEGDTIVSFEVAPKYRKRHYATKFLKKAKEHGCGYLAVEKNNRPAISLCFKNGFYIYGSNKKQLLMRLRSLKD